MQQQRGPTHLRPMLDILRHKRVTRGYNKAIRGITMIRDKRSKGGSIRTRLDILSMGMGRKILMEDILVVKGVWIRLQMRGKIRFM